MPKMIAPHGAHWRGRALQPGDTIEVADADVAALAAHGFRLSQEEQSSTGAADVPSASDPSVCAGADKPAFAKASAGQVASPPKLQSSGGGMSAVPVESSMPATAASAVDRLSRKNLLKRLKGRGLGNLFVKSTDELRALAARSTEAPHGDE